MPESVEISPKSADVLVGDNALSFDASKDEVSKNEFVISEPSVAWSWVTGEVLIYGVLIAMTIGIRVSHLGNLPLSPTEAVQALVAHHIIQGDLVQETRYSPLLASLNSLIFFLFGPSDLSARIGPVILGLSLVLLPIGLRKQLGILGALYAAGLLSISASSLFWSRTVSGEIVAAVGSLLLLVGLVKWLDEKIEGGLFVVMGGIVFLLLSTASGYTALLTSIVAGIVFALVYPKAAIVFQKHIKEKKTIQGAAVFGLILLVLCSSTWLFNMSGLALISELFSLWLSQFGVAQVRYPTILLLVWYEPLLLILGLISVGLAFYSRNKLQWALAIWLVVFLGLDLLMGGRDNGQILLAVVALALLSGQYIAQMLSQLQAQGRMDADGLFISIVWVVSIFIYITLTTWVRCTEGQDNCDTAWILPAAGAVLIIGLSIIFLVWYGSAFIGRGLGVISLLTIGLLAIGFSWRLSFSPLPDRPYHLMLTQTPTSQLQNLRNQLSQLSAEHTGDIRTLNIALVNLDTPWLRWYMRDFRQARFISSFTALSPISNTQAMVILAPSEAGQPTDGSYSGQDFSLLTHWSLDTLEGKAWLQWYLYRHVPQRPTTTDHIILWVQRK